MKRLAAGVMALALLLAGTASVRADQVYHTERLTLDPVGGASGSGMVVNIHPNGPEVYAIEQYQLSAADPGATYQVWLHLYLSGQDEEDCDGSSPDLSLNTAQIETNVAGNGIGQLVLTPEDVEGLPESFPIKWTVTQGAGQEWSEDDVTHKTDCTIVALD